MNKIAKIIRSMPLKLFIKIQNTVSIKKYAFSDTVEICYHHYMDCIIHEKFTERHQLQSHPACEFD